MSIKEILRSTQSFALRNSPTILTTIGCMGFLSTAFLAGRAGYRTALLISEASNPPRMQGEDIEPLSGRQKIEMVWKEFIPPAVIGALTFSALIGANRIGNRRAAALAAAFSISERMAEEYRQKVLEHIGPQKEEMVRSDVARERIQNAGTETIILGDAQVVHFDAWSGRAFPATIAQIDAAVNQINYQINQQWSASLTEFYDLLGLPKTAVSDDFGWNTDHQLVPYYTSCLLPDGKPAREIRFDVEPFQGYNKIGI